MILDQFDHEVLSEKGYAQDLMKQFYGVKISQNNAQKQLAGIRRHLKYKERMEETKGETEEIEIKADGSRTTKRMIWLSEEDSKSPQRLMSLMGYDCVQWELISCKTRRTYWDVTIKNTEKEGVKHTNHAYMCELTVKPIQDILTIDMVRETLEELKLPKIDGILYEKRKGLLLELPMVDFHLGLLSWGEETGEDYDLKIAEQLYKDTILDIVARVKSYRLDIEKIIFHIGQDFYNSDTVTNTTTKGTVLASDTRWNKMYLRGIELLVWAIEHLRQIAPVEIIHVPGNHDKILSYCATVTLEAFYKDTEGIRVDVSPKPRKYIQFGKCLLGFAHGADEGNRIKGLMQIEAPEMWGDTKYREMHLGHLHHETVEEHKGVIYRHIGTMKMTDAWETEMGFIGATHKTQAFVWDREKGKVLTIESTIDTQK